MPATAEFTATFRPTVLNIVQIDIFNTAHFGFNTKRTVISSNARKLHSRMFNLLILQLLNPVVFMYLPCMMSYILVPVNAMNVDYICTLTYSSFAVFPLITVGKQTSFAVLSAGFGGYRGYGFVGLLLFFMIFLFVLLLIYNSFIYRFILLCRQTVLDIIQIDIFDTAHFGFNQKDLQGHPVDIIIFSQFFIIMLLIFATIIYCIHKILNTLKRAAISSNARKLHSRMFNLLILQLLNPITFLYLPCMMSNILIAVGAINIDYICALISSSFAVFPLVNPASRQLILHI
ncbi:hypothetical protein ANCCEY_03901 [Ancylostoma ceylanicum]|uniref:Uncharacterized protein n=1 Tax=Ancylostoma ceylanicum TaxID=53326 RepID=A0A0D6M0J7_9BILA|nr:hypothetical protein ANCCEY_03901 [Ancylostoma ceylanicum]